MLLFNTLLMQTAREVEGAHKLVRQYIRIFNVSSRASSSSCCWSDSDST